MNQINIIKLKEHDSNNIINSSNFVIIESLPDIFMTLQQECKTVESKELCDHICRAIIALSPDRKSYTKKLNQAVGAALADLLLIAAKPAGTYLYRPRAMAHFTGQRIGYRVAIDALDGLLALDYLYHSPGVWAGSKAQGEGDASRYRAKPNLLELALRFGITPGNWKQHFVPAPRSPVLPHAIMVRAKRQYWDSDEKGRIAPFDKTDPAYITAFEQVARINTYMAPQAITGCQHTGFRRIFNHGDQPNFAFNMGGRLYSVGDSYQNMEKGLRSGMRINGEPVVELDLRASFLTIIYGLEGVTLRRDDDPYDIDALPRDVVKAWIAMTLGYDRFHSQWSLETVSRAKRDGIDLPADYPIDTVRQAVLNKHPALAGWKECPMRWPHLQYLESSAIIDAVELLGSVHDVCALPLHDALLVPISKLATAQAVLTRTFKQRIGVEPVFTLKDAW